MAKHRPPLPPSNELGLTDVQLRNFYETEKELVTRLRRANKEERPHLYHVLYDELLRRVPSSRRCTRTVRQCLSGTLPWRQIFLYYPEPPRLSNIARCALRPAP